MAGLIQATAEIDKLDKDVKSMIDTLQTIKQIHSKYPDLMIYKVEEQSSRFIACSSQANKIVDQYEQSEQTDPDTVKTRIYVWPYMVDDGSKVFSNPPYYQIGTVNADGFGVVPENGWEDQMESDSISHSVVRKIRTFLKSKPPISYV